MLRLAALALSTLTLTIAPPAVAKDRNHCRIKYVTNKRSYLDVGRSDGVALLDKLSVLHNGRTVGTCSVDSVAEHAATCISDVAQVGDTCVAPRAAATTTTTPKTVRSDAPTPRTAAAQAQIDRAIESTPVDKVAFSAAHTSTGNPRPLFSASIGHAAYVSFDGRHYEQERIDLQLRGVSLRFAGFRAYAALTAVLASVRPAEQRFRPSEIAQIYVWQTEFSSREHGRPFAFAIGRIYPRFAPGLTVLDGAQVGWRKRDGSVEVGAFGGTMPDPTTLYPSYRRWLAGLYFGHVWNPRGNAGALRMVLDEGRINLRETDKAGLQLETELSLLFSFGKRFDFATAARATLGAGRWGNPELEAVRAHFNVRPLERLRIAGTFRYLGERAVDYDGLSSMFSQGRQYYGAVEIVGDPLRWLSLSVGSLVQHDEASKNGRYSLHGELSFTKLPRRGGAVAVGYQESFGWLRGHAAYVQYNNAELERVRLMIRATYSEDQPIVDGPWQREVSANLFGEVRLVRWLSLRLSGIARIVVAGPNQGGEADEGRALNGGVVARADLIGSI